MVRGTAWENVGVMVTAMGAGTAYGAYQQGQWGDLAMAVGAMALGLLVAYAGLRVRLNAEVEKQRLDVMLEELRAPRRSQASSKERLDPGSRD